MWLGSLCPKYSRNVPPNGCVPLLVPPLSVRGGYIPRMFLFPFSYLFSVIGFIVDDVFSIVCKDLDSRLSSVFLYG